MNSIQIRVSPFYSKPIPACSDHDIAIEEDDGIDFSRAAGLDAGIIMAEKEEL